MSIFRFVGAHRPLVWWPLAIALVGPLASGCVSDPEKQNRSDFIPTVAGWNPDWRDSLTQRGVIALEVSGPVEFPEGPARAIRISAGTHRLPVRADFSPVELRVRFELTEPPIVGLLYTIELLDGAMVSPTGQAVQRPEPLTFRLTEAPDHARWERVATPDLSFAADVAPLLARCVGCHAQHDGLPFTWECPVLQPADSAPGQYLVEPGEPASSALLLRLLEAYSGPGQLMPPYWSDTEPLTTAEARRIELWIISGAPR